ncbi:CheY-like chemotaxis protein [Azospirillum fermentarium]|uniref:response regulator n=1 Tax=Azospirillum fermentarium TaxID=1233114 RepID=UPI0022273EC2|nr:response regulator [Azospirillum fermentarium]MCW2248796.1 CheY-like chemotaxis protein [Azospirillum fermentarium]
MPEYDFSTVEAAIIDQQPHSLRVLREVLVRLGIKRVDGYGSVKDAASMLSTATPDLILADADGEEAETLRFIRTLRNEPGVPNPFATVIVTTWQPTPALLLRVTNTGADDLMVKPVSPKQVQDRLAALIESRKKFVVTADYTGPDRRKSPREGTQVPLIDAPNTLRLRATGRWDQINLRQLMIESCRQVNGQKLLRGSVQVAFLVELARPSLAAAEKPALDHVARVPAVIDDIHRRLPEGKTVPVTALCVAMKKAVETVRIQAAEGRVGEEAADRLTGLAYDLMRALDPARPLEAMQQEVQGAVAGYRARLEQMAAAKAAAAKPPAEAPAADAGKGEGAAAAPPP